MSCKAGIHWWFDIQLRLAENGRTGSFGCELRNKHSNKGKQAMTFCKYLPRGVDNSVSGARSDSEFS